MELRPIERRVVKLRSAGLPPVEIASRFLRTPEWVKLVERMAAYKQGK